MASDEDIEKAMQEWKRFKEQVEVMTFGENLKKIRKNMKLTQTEMAERLDISQNYLSDIENGNRNITVNKLIIFANELEVSVNKLINDNIKL